MDHSANYYEVLAVDRTADERTIKKSYFALVRKFPPETHPAEFQRIREAYDVLSNPDARRAYDATDSFSQYGDHFSALMKEATAALDAGEQDRAQSILLSVLEQKPDLYAARDMLGMSLLRSQAYEAALKEFTRLMSEQPQNHLYPLHKAYVQHAQKQYSSALKSYEAALKLSPNDLPTMVSTADCLSSMGMYEQALSHLDKAINLDGQVDLQDFGMLMRRLEIQLLRNRSDLADQEIERIIKVLPPNDPDSRKYVASRFAALAAEMFALQRSHDANRLLKKSKELDPKSSATEFPVKVKLKVEELPEKSREWLERYAAEPDAFKLNQSPYVWPVLAALMGFGWLFVQAATILDSRRLWSSDFKVALFITCLFAPLLTAWGIRSWVKVAKGKLKKFTGVHPLYLLQCSVDQLVVWPFANLQEVFITHHSTNGVYTNSVVRMKFPGTTTSVSIRGQNASVEWANHVLARRRRVLELLSSGLLEAEEGIDFLPAEQLKSDVVRQSPGSAYLPSLRFYGAFAAAGVAAFLVSLPFNRYKVQDRYWSLLKYQSSLAGYQRFREQFPDSRHDAEAQAEIAKYYDQATLILAATADDSRPGYQALTAMLDKLKEAGTSRVHVTYEGKTAFDNATKQGAISPVAAFSGFSATARETEVTAALNSAFAQMVRADLLQLTADKTYADGTGARRPVESPVTMHVKYAVSIGDGPVYRSMSGRTSLYPLTFDWEVSVTFKGETSPRYTFATTSIPADGVGQKASRLGSDSEVVPYGKLSASAFWDFSRQLAWDMGVLLPETQPAAPAYNYASDYPY